jgi:hypothetical protein
MPTPSPIRDRLLSSNTFSSKIVIVKVPAKDPKDPPEDLRVLVRQPTVGQRSEILAQMKVGKDGELRSGDGLSRGMALAIIRCARDPDSNGEIFTLEDLDSLVGQPSGSWFDDLAGEAMSLMNDAAENAKK